MDVVVVVVTGEKLSVKEEHAWVLFYAPNLSTVSINFSACFYLQTHRKAPKKNLLWMEFEKRCYAISVESNQELPII